jgi:hypothetical protein
MTDALCGTASTGLYSTVLYMMASSVASSSLLLTVAHDVRGFEEMHHVLLFPQHKRGFWPVAVDGGLSHKLLFLEGTRLYSAMYST